MTATNDTWVVWDESTGEARGPISILATSSSEAAETYAGCYVDGVPSRGRPEGAQVLVRAPDGSLRRHSVVALETRGYRSASVELVRAGWGDDATRAAPAPVPAPDAAAEPAWRRYNGHEDPWWEAHLRGLNLHVGVVLGTPWAWEWTVFRNEAMPGGTVELAHGSVFMEEADDEHLAGTWNYQGVERVQQRCVLVAKALLADGEGAHA